MFYRRKFYIVKNEFVEILNAHFIENNLPTQLKYGARLVGRWMTPYDESSTEIFAIWEYDSYEKYIQIETNVRMISLIFMVTFRMTNKLSTRQ